MLPNEIKPIVADIHHRAVLEVMGRKDAYHCCAVVSYSLANLLNAIDDDSYSVVWAGNTVTVPLIEGRDELSNWCWPEEVRSLGADKTDEYYFQHCWVESESEIIDLTAYTYEMWMARKPKAIFGFNPPTRFRSHPEWGYIWGSVTDLPLRYWQWWTNDRRLTGNEGKGGLKDLRRKSECGYQIEAVERMSMERLMVLVG